jgi:sarcosine oxidase subunit beta
LHATIALRRDVALAERAEIASADGKRWVRNSSSRRPPRWLAQESTRLRGAGDVWFQQVGYLFLATTEAGLAELEERRELQAELGVPVERVDPRFVPGMAVEDVVGAVFCGTDGVADPPALTREVVRRAAELGVDVQERTDARELERDVLVIAAGAYSGEFGVDLPIRPLTRQLLETDPIEGLPADLPMVIEVESGFHFRRRYDCLRIAMADAVPRWGARRWTTVLPIGASACSSLPPALGTIACAWAGLYDMTPDASLRSSARRRRAVRRVRFSDGFMQSLAGPCVAESCCSASRRST